MTRDALANILSTRLKHLLTELQLQDFFFPIKHFSSFLLYLLFEFSTKYFFLLFIQFFFFRSKLRCFWYFLVRLKLKVARGELSRGWSWARETFCLSGGTRDLCKCLKSVKTFRSCIATSFTSTKFWGSFSFLSIEWRASRELFRRAASKATETCSEKLSENLLTLHNRVLRRTQGFIDCQTQEGKEMGRRKISTHRYKFHSPSVVYMVTSLIHKRQPKALRLWKPFAHSV